MEESAARLVSVAEVVARTGLAERTVRQLVANGRLPSVRPLGLRVVRIPERAVLALMGAGDVPAS